jgi:hypothetical protein
MKEYEYIKLGDLGKDKVSGYKGICISITEWLNGCRRVSLQSRELKDGKPIDFFSFDIEQVEVVKADAMNMLTHTGGPMPDIEKF